MFRSSSIFVLFRRPTRLYKFNWRETSVHCGAEAGTSPFAVAIREMPDSRKRSDQILSWLIAFLAVSAAYLYTFPQANIFYAVIVLLHSAGGVLAAILLVPMLFRLLRSSTPAGRAGWFLIAAGALVGLILIKTGTPRTEWNKLYLHIALSLAGLALLIAGWLSARSSSDSRSVEARLAAGASRVVLCLALFAGVGDGARYVRGSWESRNRIQNPAMPPECEMILSPSGRVVTSTPKP